MTQRPQRPNKPTRIVSGGQTGVDRAALDVALELGLPCGGWCPAGRWAEDGPLDAVYPLSPTPSRHPAQRTRWNVRDSDGTLILLPDAADPAGGTALTLASAHSQRRPVHVARLQEDPEQTLREAREWLDANGIATLNVAGPRESQAPGLYAAAHGWLSALLDVGPVASPASRESLPPRL